jgi:hypothetical protein
MASRLSLLVRVAIAATVGACAAAARPLPADAPLFSSDEPVAFRLSAPLNDLFDRARIDDDYSVAGTLSYTHAGHEVSIDGVRVSLRGHTSKGENECAFPKLKVQLPANRAAAGPLLSSLTSLKIGTHCGEAGGETLTAKYGRMPNEQSPAREAFVYRLLDAVGVPTLKARPARFTYVYTDARPSQSPAQEQPLVRNAVLLEDADEAVRRFGGTHDIGEQAFTNARAQFEPADTARLALAEAMIGNFDWCLKMTADDTYRCNARHPLWNVIAAASDGGKARPIIHDFDLSGMVVARHPWFKTVFNDAFSASGSETEVKVIAQVQRTRSLFPRAVLDAVRDGFLHQKDAAYRALGAARLDADGRQNAIAYLDSFFKAIESDEVFYRPVVATEGSKLYANEDHAPLCTSRGAIPIGTPVSAPLQTKESMMQVVVLDALWHWAPPAKCPAVQNGPVWIDADVVSRDFPKAGH